MLGKLLKYEIKATARIFLPLCAVLLVFAAVNRGISAISGSNWQAPQVISMMLYVIILVGTLVMNLVVTIQRFYKNLLSDEGYLMFTLPVKVWKHIVCKLLVMMMWMVVSCIVAIVSILIIASRYFTSEFIQLVINGVSEFFSAFNMSIALIILEILLICIVSLVSKVLIVYASISIGHLFNRHRILASLVAFIALNAASQILSLTVSLIPGGIAFFDSLNRNPSVMQITEPGIQIIIWLMIIFTALLSAVYFIITNHILSKRLNLE